MKGWGVPSFFPFGEPLQVVKGWGVQPLSFREPVQRLIQVVKRWGVQPLQQGSAGKTLGFRVSPLYHSVGGARGVGMHGASRLALPRLRVRVLCRTGLRGGGCRALSEDFVV